MKNSAVTLKPLWINHIERFSDRMRPRLYAALIAYLYRGTPVPEKLMPHLGIILDLIEEEFGIRYCSDNDCQAEKTPVPDESQEATASVRHSTPAGRASADGMSVQKIPPKKAHDNRLCYKMQHQ
ncbi:MAG: hypothetical protein K2M19_01505 [Muribaculaceae bacterium]|nr:hypothetical protein [Muribaculaceae bacterium]